MGFFTGWNKALRESVKDGIIRLDGGRMFSVEPYDTLEDERFAQFLEENRIKKQSSGGQCPSSVDIAERILKEKGLDNE